MTRSQSGGLLPLNPEIDRSCRQLRRQQRARLATEERIDGHLSSDSEEEHGMDGDYNQHQGNPQQVPPVNQVLGNNPIPQDHGVHHPPQPGPTLEYYYTPRIADIRPVILYPPIPANNFEIKPCWIQLITSSIQFHGLKDEEARVHLSRFLQLTNGFKLNGVPDDAIRLHLFPHSLAGNAKRWLETQPPLSITSWDDLADKFVHRYYPASKTTEIQREITHFRQEPDESLRDAWERYMGYFWQCPHHGFSDAFTVGNFYNALSPDSQRVIESLCLGGDVLTKTPPELNQMINTLASRDHSWGQSSRGRHSRDRGVHAMETRSGLEQQVAELVQTLKQPNSLIPGRGLATPPVAQCQWCESSNHLVEDCQAMRESTTPQEQLAFIANARRLDPYSNTYNEGWRQHPNFAWSSNTTKPPGFPAPTGGFQQRQPFQARQGPDPQQQLYQPRQGQPFQQPQCQFAEPAAAPAPDDRMTKLENILASFMTSTQATITRLDQSVASLEAGQRNQGAILQDLQTQVGILARQTTTRAPGTLPATTVPNPRDPHQHQQLDAIFTRSGKTISADPVPARQEVPLTASALPADDAEVRVEKEAPAPKPQPVVKEHVPQLPFPTRLHKDKLETEFAKFMAMLKQLNISIPFVEALSKMPKYAKFMKDLCTNKKKLGDLSTVMLSEECSAILQNKLPEKRKDPGSFTIPLTIGSMHVGKSLEDLGASINVMPYKLYKMLDLGELSPTRMSIQLADRSIVHPRGIIEDLLVGVGAFTYPVDFVILDVHEDVDVPLILGRPFLATAKALIDVHDGKLILRAGNEHATFSVTEFDHCAMIAVTPVHAMSDQVHEPVVYPSAPLILQDPPIIPSPPLHPASPPNKKLKEEWRPKQQVAKPARKKSGDHYELVPPPAPRPPWPSGYSLACILPNGQVELTDEGGRIRRGHGHTLQLYLKSDVDPLLEAPVSAPP
ncbi:unnamed protein product [Linum trigynum]|uniref:Retrotransposon gag domain-containing protein n=1 Tax=Linum trigynum TaxID=586398 RepID=A0AAV2FTY0_9ROSI